MQITAKHLIKDGGKRYEPGEIYEVDDETGRRFVANGWATAEGVEAGVPSAVTVTLRPDSATHMTTSKER